MENINCSVTVMPVRYKDKRIGFVRRAKDDTFGGLLVAPGGKIEEKDMQTIDETPYFVAEFCAIRELMEEANLETLSGRLKYFCSLRLPKNNRVVISFYIEIFEYDKYSNLEFYNAEEIKSRNDFAPGMKEEALMLLRLLKY